MQLILQIPLLSWNCSSHMLGIFQALFMFKYLKPFKYVLLPRSGPRETDSVDRESDTRWLESQRASPRKEDELLKVYLAYDYEFLHIWWHSITPHWEPPSCLSCPLTWRAGCHEEGATWFGGPWSSVSGGASSATSSPSGLWGQHISLPSLCKEWWLVYCSRAPPSAPQTATHLWYAPCPGSTTCSTGHPSASARL